MIYFRNQNWIKDTVSDSKSTLYLAEANTLVSSGQGLILLWIVGFTSEILQFTSEILQFTSEILQFYF